MYICKSYLKYGDVQAFDRGDERVQLMQAGLDGNP